MDVPSPDVKRMKLRYAGTCRGCAKELPAKSEAFWDRTSKSVRCLECPPEYQDVQEIEPAADESGSLEDAEVDIDPLVEGHDIEVDAGIPGASARREYERRKANKDARIKAKYPRMGKLIVAIAEEPQSTKAWEKGAVGEERLGRALDERSSDRLRVLHDRGIPGSRANIDHLVVAPTGIWVVDPKRYKGRPELQIEGGLLRPRVEKLVVAGRDRSKLVEGALKQVDLVRNAIGEGVPVRGVLCFIESDWPLLSKAFQIQGIHVLWPKKLYPMLESDGPLSEEDIDALHKRLAGSFPPA